MKIPARQMVPPFILVFLAADLVFFFMASSGWEMMANYAFAFLIIAAFFLIIGWIAKVSVSVTLPCDVARYVFSLPEFEDERGNAVHASEHGHGNGQRGYVYTADDSV